MKKLLFQFAFICISLTALAQPVYKDVAAIFHANCTSCHNQYSHGPSFLNYSQINDQIVNIQADLTSGKMPPWTPDTTYTRFLHERSITLADKNAILNWITAGALPGDTTQAPPAPIYPPYQLNATPDLIVHAPTFTSNANSVDSYVCFSLPTGLTQDRILRAYEIIPGNPKIVHHIVVNVDTTGTTASDLSGSCFSEPGQYSIGGFAPGSPPTIFPAQAPLKMGIRIKAGSNLVLQIHYPAGTIGEVDSSKIRLYFYPVNATGVRPVYVTTDLQNWSLSIPANTVKSYSALYPSSGTLPNTRSIFSTFPHSHKLATSIINYAYTATDTVPLIRINNWDFNQQGYYTFIHMPKVTAGHKLYSKHIYDNTTNNLNNPNSPPLNVNAGFSTTDEMLFDSFQWMIYQPGDELIDVKALLANDSLLMAGVKENSVLAPKDFKTYAFPNPFENSVRIGYELNHNEKVNIEIYSIYGSNVRTLHNSFENTGLHEIVWDGKNNNGTALSAGSYFYIIKAGDQRSSGKLILLSSKN